MIKQLKPYVKSINLVFKISNSQEVHVNESRSGFTITKYLELNQSGLWREIDLAKLEILHPEEVAQIKSDVELALNKLNTQWEE